MHGCLLAVFWLGCALIAYTYLLYPLAVQLLARRTRDAVGAAATTGTRSFSLVIAVHDEAARIGARLRELVSLARGCGDGEIIVVTDGCRDATAELARGVADPLVRVVELAENCGKSQALTRGCAVARGDILVFADARQRWAEDALAMLLSNFSQPQLGAVSGELVLETASGALAGVGLYWRYEKWLRRGESRLHSTVGVSGSIAAVRRELFQPIPRGILLDDVYWPLQVVMQGYRVVHDERARAYDCLPERARDEFRRKVRTLSGNYQLMTALPQLLSPRRNPIWVQFVSHKLLRLLVPWALIGVFLSSALLHGWPYQLAFWTQLLLYGAALLGLSGVSRSRIAQTAASFVTLNAAAWLAFWVWASGGSAAAWSKVHYQRVPGGE
jgi:cellulose synthase/poly-beta-1,6-N-acetylglucosamine synthase-like glycosyltransferase